MSEHGPRESTPHDTFFEPGTRPLERIERGVARAIQEIFERDRQRLGIQRALPHIGEALHIRVHEAFKGGEFDPKTGRITIGPASLYETIITLTHELVHDTSTGTWEHKDPENTQPQDGQIGFIPMMPPTQGTEPRPRDHTLMQGLNEGVTEHYTRYVLSHYADVFEKHVPGFVLDELREYIKHTEHAHNHGYNPQVNAVDDVITQVWEYEYGLEPNNPLTYESVRDDIYRAYFGALLKKDDRKMSIALAQRIEKACGPGTVNALESMKAPHSGLGISVEEANASVPTIVTYHDAIPVPVRLQRKDMYALAAHIAEQNPDLFTELPWEGAGLKQQKRSMLIRFANPAMRIMEREFPADRDELDFIRSAHRAIKSFLDRLGKKDSRGTKEEKEAVAKVLNDRYTKIDAYIHFMEHRAHAYTNIETLTKLVHSLRPGGDPTTGIYSLVRNDLLALEDSIREDERVYGKYAPTLLRRAKSTLERIRNTFRGKTHPWIRRHAK